MEIMRNSAALALAVALSFLWMPATAQNKSGAEKSAGAKSTVSSSTAVPEVKEAQPGQGQSGLMSGDKPFSLMVDPDVGELVYTFDQNTHELETINAKRGVIFASADMTLNSDEFEYKTLNSQLVATGKKVVVRMGDMVVTCQLFKYNPQTQEGQFLGGPILYNRDKEGKVTTTGGKAISVFNQNGKFQMRVVAGQGVPTYVRSSGTEASSETQPLENKTLAPGEKPAIMTLNSKGSPVTVGTSTASSTNDTGNGGASTNGLIAVPKMSSGSGSKKAAAPGQINPDNPDDVKKFSQDKSE
jgi:hypothetical protein